jgi:DnaJ homolog subfamily A member 5
MEVNNFPISGYAWLCPHNISEIRDRRILREIEKESKKIQQKARKERNEEIRSLVSFVRKRDRRVIAYKKLLEEKAEKNRLKTQQIRLEQMRKRNAELEEQRKSLAKNAINDGYEEKLRQLESNLYGSSDDDDDDDFLSDVEELSGQLADADLKDDPESVGGDDEFLDQLYCVACDKEFKSVSAFSNHESSKKHKQNVDALKQEMLDEESNVSSEQVNGDGHANGGDDNKEDESDEAEEEEVIAKSKSKKSGKKQKKLAKVASYASDDTEDDQEKTDEVLNNLLGKAADQEATSDDWGDTKKSAKKAKTPKNKTANSAKPAPAVATTTDEPEKVAKKSVKAKPKPEKPKKYDPDDEKDPIDTDQVCVTCKAQFDSKNKLFGHLKKTGHGVYIPKPEEYVVEKKGKKRK